MNNSLLTDDEFSLFNLTATFNISTAALRKRYQLLMREHHPDQGEADKSQQEKLLQQQIASRVNSAFERLSDPFTRAQYLLTVLGYDDENHKRHVPAAFLAEQITWHERILAAVALDKLMLLSSDITKQEQQCEQSVALLFKVLPDINAKCAEAVGAYLREWNFWRRLATAVEEKIEQLG